MNLILFDTAQEARYIPSADPRARHIRQVLRMKEGDSLFVGVADGPRGKAVIVRDTAEGLWLDVSWERQIEPLYPLCVLVGLPRPQTAKDVLRQAATLGIAQLWFFRPQKGEPSYGDSRLWHTDQWRTLLREGAQQAFSTGLPQVRHFESLEAALTAVEPGQGRVALDVYEAGAPLSRCVPDKGALTLAIGAERGWSAQERTQLRAAQFTLAHLGARVLRTEDALVAGFSVWMTVRGDY